MPRLDVHAMPGKNPVLGIRSQSCVLVTQAIASIPVRALNRSVGSLVEHRDRITRALDTLLVGFRAKS